MIDTVPSEYRELVAQVGMPLGVEDARAQWGRLIQAAQNGDVTLITRERWEWAAITPVSAVTGPFAGLPVLPLSTARRKLGDLVRQAGQPYEDLPLLLTRHRTPVAALLAARVLAAERHGPTPEELLSSGHTIVLGHASGPEGPVYSAVARDGDGNEVAVGSGGSVREALLLKRA